MIVLGIHYAHYAVAKSHSPSLQAEQDIVIDLSEPAEERYDPSQLRGAGLPTQTRYGRG